MVNLDRVPDSDTLLSLVNDVVTDGEAEGVSETELTLVALCLEPLTETVSESVPTRDSVTLSEGNAEAVTDGDRETVRVLLEVKLSESVRLGEAVAERVVLGHALLGESERDAVELRLAPDWDRSLDRVKEADGTADSVADAVSRSVLDTVCVSESDTVRLALRDFAEVSDVERDMDFVGDSSLVCDRVRVKESVL